MNIQNLSRLLISVKKAYYERKPKIDYNYVNHFLKQAENYSIISFDIFDTVLTRLFECPIDVFAFVEGRLAEDGYNFSNFGQLRKQAEQIARHKQWQNQQHEEVTIDEIYNEFSFLTAVNTKILEKAKEYELMTELECIVSSVDHEYLITKLKQQGKKIIFVSDMYLPDYFIQKILKHIGLDCYDDLYLSSALMQTKSSGQIWNTVLLHYPNEKILHIGDNLNSDIKIPQKYNINTQHYVKLYSYTRVGAQLSPNLVPFSLMARVRKLTDCFTNENLASQFWLGLGETLGAFILQSFIDWLADEVQKNGIEHIYFCARDAQIIQKVWDYFEYDKKCHTTSSYLYLSRHIVRFSACYIELIEKNQLSDNSLTFLLNDVIQWGDTYQDWIKKLGIKHEQIAQTNFNKKFGSLNNEVDFNRLSELRQFLQQELMEFLTPIFSARYQAATNYYHQEGLFNKNRKTAIVDLGWNGTIQMSLIKFLEHKNNNQKLYGYYYGLFNHSAPGRIYKNGPMKAAFFNAFLRPDEDFLMENSVNILENLHSADHETTVDFAENKSSQKYEPVFKENNDYLDKFNQTFKLFQQGIFNTLQYWKKQQSMYGVGCEWAKPKIALAAILQVCVSPNSDEQKYLGNIQHSPTFDHSKLRPLIDPQIPQTEDDVSKLLYIGGWPCGVMSFWRDRKDKLDNNIYNAAINHFSHFPQLIKNHLVG